MSIQTHLEQIVRSCSCISLRTRCFILGYLNLIFNILHTLGLVAVTTYIGVSTHGFDHFDPDEPHMVSDQPSSLESLERPLLNRIGFLLLVILSVNAVWLIVNIACLVGVHKRRPGPIRLYVAFATVRLILSIAGFIYMTMTTSSNTSAVVTRGIEIVLTAYFMVVYYVYAIQLEREQQGNQFEKEVPVGDIAFMYPYKVDKQSLVA